MIRGYAFLILACCLAACAKRDATSATVVPSDASDWTYAELLDHLKARGLPLTMAPCRAGQLFLITTEGDERTATTAASGIDAGGKLATAITCIKSESARQAKEAADQRGSFTWGRFAFNGDEEAINLFRQALATKEPVSDSSPDLSYEELAEKLKSKGLPAKLRTVRDNRLVVLADSDALVDRIVSDFDTGRVRKDHTFRVEEFKTIPATTVAAFNSGVIVVKHRFHIQAIESAGGNSASSFAWGRFSFFAVQVIDPTTYTTNDALKKIKASLQ
ncbi:MAG: hypothetical protein K8U57_14155 [Planctomycetes bacterium]|nr:hypothetical protein [Planctomycetota bacterium]